MCNVSVYCCRCSWAEVSFILRKPIKTEEDMMYTVAAAEAGIIFTDQVRATLTLRPLFCCCAAVRLTDLSLVVVHR